MTNLRAWLPLLVALGFALTIERRRDVLLATVAGGAVYFGIMGYVAMQHEAFDTDSPLWAFLAAAALITGVSVGAAWLLNWASWRRGKRPPAGTGGSG